MRRVIYNMILSCSVLLLFAACNGKIDIPSAKMTEGDKIILNIKSDALPKRRATVEATGIELAVNHIDVLIFEEDGNKVWSDRFYNTTDESGTIILSVAKNSFSEDADYWVYLIANSSAPKSTFDALATLNNLKGLKQSDMNIHLTGLDGYDIPQDFLMDGIAHQFEEEEPLIPGTVVLNSSIDSSDTKLEVTLRRAAAKVIVILNRGSNINYDNTVSDAGYYIRNMPYSTSVVAGVNADADLRITPKTSGSYFHWTPDQITYTAYMYAHNWEDASTLEKGVRLVVNIPIIHNLDPDNPIAYPSNYYQIPISKFRELKRNTCYQVIATVNTPGADDPAEPLELSDLRFSVIDWNERTINIGGEEERPTFLTLNMYNMEMHNKPDDPNTLRFVSSSDVSATINNVYYFDKFGQRKDLQRINNTDEFGIRNGNNWNNRAMIWLEPDPGLSGNILVHGDIPQNNTIRYVEVTITNADGISRNVIIAQYPLEFITNVQGWYSYRSDFGGTTYELLKGMDVLGQTYTTEPFSNNSWTTGANWNNNNWSYSTNYSSSLTFRPKVATMNSDGTSRLSFYVWERQRSGSYFNYSYSYTRSTTRSAGNSSTNLNNARMYHVRITATSGEYTVSVPRMTADGFTDSGADNAELVSPSFMIASQLGAVQNENSINAAAGHCNQYVEVYQNAAGQTIHLDDWRLPTKAEVMIIMKFQNSSEAMDEVLAGDYYWCANGVVRTSDGQMMPNRNSYIRCIRNAYEDESIHAQ